MCKNMKGYKWNYIGLDSDDWHSLKNVIIDASFGKDSRQDIPENILTHETSMLLNNYFDNGNKESLEKAASILVGGGKNPWVAIFKL